MKTIQVYDPPMCCSTGLCGNDIDPALVSFAALLTQLSQKGVKVERYNLGQQPMAFVQNIAVKALLDKEGVPCCRFFVDGEVHQGPHPTDRNARRFPAALGESAEGRTNASSVPNQRPRRAICFSQAKAAGQDILPAPRR
jgi:hypothetical protein